jgi:hypothetical protein
MVQLTLAIGHKIGASLLVIEHKIGVLSFGLDTKAVDSLSFGLDTKAIDSLVLVSDTKLFTGFVFRHKVVHWFCFQTQSYPLVPSV